MKKLLIILPVIALIAAGCNSKKISENSPTVSGESVQSEQKSPVPENVSNNDKDSEAKKIAELQKQIDELKQQNRTNAAKPAPKVVENSNPKTEAPQEIGIDLCTNIQGNQSSLPVGMRRTEENNCFAKPTEASKTDDITISEISQYKSGVVYIECDNNRAGSGSLWHDTKFGYLVLTNKHVAEGSDNCKMWYEDSLANRKGVYFLDGANTYLWNYIADERLLPILDGDSSFGNFTPIPDLNYGISYISNCPSMLPEGTKIIVIGYPGSGQGNKITKDGIVSGYTSKTTGLPEKDYFISVDLDNGNSGGMAFAKWDGNLCKLGLPTYVYKGSLANQSVVVNIENIIY